MVSLVSVHLLPWAPNANGEVIAVDWKVQVVLTIVTSVLASSDSDDYSIDVTGTTVTFTNLLRTGSKVHVKILKSVKAPTAEGSEF